MVRSPPTVPEEFDPLGEVLVEAEHPAIATAATTTTGHRRR